MTAKRLFSFSIKLPEKKDLFSHWPLVSRLAVTGDRKPETFTPVQPFIPYLVFSTRSRKYA